MPLYRLFSPLLLLLGAPPTWASAQTAAGSIPGPVSSVVFAARPDSPLHPAWSSLPADTLRARIRPTYWKEGAIVGGVAGAVTLGLWGSVACGLSEQPGNDCVGTTLLLGLLGAGLGGIPGALIGGLFPKGDREAMPAAAE